MRNKFFYIVVMLMFVLLAVLSSCGYRMTLVGGVVPEDSKTIAIPVFLNGTNEPYLDTDLTQAVVDEFLTDGRLKIASLEDADLILRCKATKFELTPAAYISPSSNQSNSYVQTYAVTITVSLTLENAKTHKIILQEQGIVTRFISNYPVTLGNISATKVAKDTAVKNACRDVASTIRSRVLDGF
jgi:hypothetical protein